MAVLIPTKKIPQLTAYGAPLGGSEQMEISVVGTSRRVTTRDFVLPADSILTLTPLGVVPTNARQLISSATVQVTDNGPGSTVQLDALFTGALPGNPTSLIGLAPINGVAVTWMRSDAAPALDQGIVPTWTGLHAFSVGLSSREILISSADPYLRQVETDAAVNNRLWEFRPVGEQLRGRVGNDAAGAFVDWLEVDRTLNVIDTINLLGTAVQANGSNVLTVATAFANPTGTIGLAAVNGVAITAMRSDAAPALSQAIAPTWTAQHIFGLSGATNAAILVSSAQPQTDYNETDAAANNRRWRWEAQGEQFLGRTVDDANSAAVTWIAVDRTLNVVDTIALTSTALTWNGNPLLSTATAFANPTASIGLATVNGVATTAMRSDAAPPLSQAIVPTWTAQHIFSLTGATDAAILLSSAQPQEDWNETDAAANNRRWRLEAQGEQFLARMVNDANSAAVTWLAVDRTLNVADTIAFTATAFQTTSLTTLLTGTNAAAAGVQLRIQNLNAAADNRLMNIRINETGDVRFGVLTDALAETTWLQVERTGSTVDSVAFPTATAASFLAGTSTSLLGSVLAHFLAPAACNALVAKSVTQAAGAVVAWNNATAGDNNFVEFGTEAGYTPRGSISYNRGAGLTAYNTTSDARRKKNIRNAPEASSIIDSIRVRSFEWIDSGIHLDYWIIAQELHAVCPYAVTEGNVTQDWAVDTSKLIPLMVKEL